MFRVELFYFNTLLSGKTGVKNYFVISRAFQPCFSYYFKSKPPEEGIVFVGGRCL